MKNTYNSLVEYLAKLFMDKPKIKKKVVKVKSSPEILEAAAINPPIFIAAIGYIFYRFIYTETKKNVKGEVTKKGKWVGFFFAQALIGIVVIGEYGKDSFFLTLVAALLEYLACYLARVFAKKTKG